MSQQKPIIVPVQLHSEQLVHSAPHLAIPPLQPICTINTPTVEISFFDGIDPHVVQVIMKGIESR